LGRQTHRNLKKARKVSANHIGSSCKFGEIGSTHGYRNSMARGRRRMKKKWEYHRNCSQQDKNFVILILA